MTSDPARGQGSVWNVIGGSLDVGGLRDRVTEGQTHLADTLLDFSLTDSRLGSLDSLRKVKRPLESMLTC